MLIIICPPAMRDRQCFSSGSKVGNDDSFGGIFVFLEQKL
jgi:hypothetical protein